MALFNVEGFGGLLWQLHGAAVARAYCCTFQLLPHHAAAEAMHKCHRVEQCCACHAAAKAKPQRERLCPELAVWT